MTTTACADGATYDHARDHDRLAYQREKIWHLLQDHKWRTLWEISVITGTPEASASARLRDFRKAKFGGHPIQRRYLSDGVWEYRLGDA